MHLQQCNCSVNRNNRKTGSQRTFQWNTWLQNEADWVPRCHLVIIPFWYSSTCIQLSSVVAKLCNSWVQLCKGWITLSNGWVLTKCTVLYTRWRFIRWITLSMFRTIGARCMVRVSKKSQLPAVYHCFKTSNWRLFILWANFSVWVLLYITAVYCTINSSLLIKVLKPHVKLQLSSFNIMGWVESWFMTSYDKFNNTLSMKTIHVRKK